MLGRGGNAADAAIATAAVMAVVAPHMCGAGGDLFAVVAWPGEPPAALNASGRAGSGADAAALRGQGLRRMPFQHDVRSVTVPGCIDGLVALYQRFGSLSLSELLAPAQRLAAAGFPVSATLAKASAALAARDRIAAFGAAAPLVAGRRIRLAGIARVLDSVADAGRAGFYEDAAGAEIVALGHGEFSEEDLRAPQANWVDPLVLSAFGRMLWTVPPNSQGYLTLAGAWIAEQAGIPSDPEDEEWAPLLV
jgi:gamma-glutamyltranspeptidase / glutathione hydrolase